MSNETNTSINDETNTSIPTETTDDTETEEPEETGKGGNAEAARYRRQLRDTEIERDGLRTTVERLQRGEVTRLVGDQLAQPADLFAFGVVLDDLIDSEGRVDDGLVATAVYGLLQQRPGLRFEAPRPKGPVLTGHDQGAAPGPNWQTVLRRG